MRRFSLSLTLRPFFLLFLGLVALANGQLNPTVLENVAIKVFDETLHELFIQEYRRTSSDPVEYISGNSTEWLAYMTIGKGKNPISSTRVFEAQVDFKLIIHNLIVMRKSDNSEDNALANPKEWLRIILNIRQQLFHFRLTFVEGKYSQVLRERIAVLIYLYELFIESEMSASSDSGDTRFSESEYYNPQLLKALKLDIPINHYKSDDPNDYVGKFESLAKSIIVPMLVELGTSLQNNIEHLTPHVNQSLLLSAAGYCNPPLIIIYNDIGDSGKRGGCQEEILHTITGFLLIWFHQDNILCPDETAHLFVYGLVNRFYSKYTKDSIKEISLMTCTDFDAKSVQDHHEKFDDLVLGLLMEINDAAHIILVTDDNFLTGHLANEEIMYQLAANSQIVSKNMIVDTILLSDKDTANDAFVIQLTEYSGGVHLKLPYGDRKSQIGDAAIIGKFLATTVLPERMLLYTYGADLDEEIGLDFFIDKNMTNLALSLNCHDTLQDNPVEFQSGLQIPCQLSNDKKAAFCFLHETAGGQTIKALPLCQVQIYGSSKPMNQNKSPGYDNLWTVVGDGKKFKRYQRDDVVRYLPSLKQLKYYEEREIEDSNLSLNIIAQSNPIFNEYFNTVNDSRKPIELKLDMSTLNIEKAFLLSSKSCIVEDTSKILLPKISDIDSGTILVHGCEENRDMIETICLIAANYSLFSCLTVMKLQMLLSYHPPTLSIADNNIDEICKYYIESDCQPDKKGTTYWQLHFNTGPDLKQIFPYKYTVEPPIQTYNSLNFTDRFQDSKGIYLKGSCCLKQLNITIIDNVTGLTVAESFDVNPRYVYLQPYSSHSETWLFILLILLAVIIIILCIVIACLCFVCYRGKKRATQGVYRMELIQHPRFSQRDQSVDCNLPMPAVSEDETRRSSQPDPFPASMCGKQGSDKSHSNNGSGRKRQVVVV